MKKFTFILSLTMLLGLFSAQTVVAQGQGDDHTEKVDMNTGLVVWTGSTIEEALAISQPTAEAPEGGFFFLVEFKDSLDVNDKEKYVGARGDYGVQGILSSVGMRMQLVTADPSPISLTDQPSGPYYQFVSRIENADHTSGYLGDRMGLDNETDAGASIYLDRSNTRNYYNDDQNNCNNFPNWKLNLVPQENSKKYNVRYKGEDSSHEVNVTTYTIQNVETQNKGNFNYYPWWGYLGTYKPTYITIQDGKLVSTFDESKATKFIIVSEADFEDAMAAVTWGEVDLGVFVQDATFGRDNKDGIYWVWETDGEGNPAEEDAKGKTLDGRQLTGDNIHWHQRNQDIMINGVELASGERTVRHQDGDNVWFTYETSRETIGRNVAGYGNNENEEYVDHNWCRQNLAQYYAAEIYNEENSLTQTLHGSTIPNLIDGLYKFTAQALYYDDVDGSTNDGVAYFVVKREELDEQNNVIPDKTTIEYMPIKPMMNESLGSTITPHSGVSAGYVFNNNEKAYLLTTYVEINGRTNLTIGIQQRQATGWTVIGNVHLYAHGKQALMVDEDWGEEATLSYKIGDMEDFDSHTGNPYTMAKWYDNYDYPSTVYYQRSLKKNAWNTICMPLDLTGRQVRQAFGDEAKVCAFMGQRGGDPDGCILFSRSADLDQDENMNKVVIKAGVPYLIYVTNDPQRIVEQGSHIELEVGNGQYNHTVRVDGSCYIIPGVIKDQYMGYHVNTGTEQAPVYELLPPIDISKNIDSSTLGDEHKDYFRQLYNGFTLPNASDIHFKGSFYHTVLSNSTTNYNEYPNHPILSDADYWVVTKGNMYHLTGTKEYNIWATYAYLYLPKSSGGNANRNLTFAVEGDGIEEQITVIEDLFVDRGEGFETDGVYTLSGQKVADGLSLDGLSKGIYVMKGKKYVVK